VSSSGPNEGGPRASDQYVLLRAFVDELARCGLRAACTSPGSRCAPLVLTLAQEPRVRCFSHIDERCSGFFALGLAKSSGLPVAVACTSGTAAAELLGAAIEAHEARVPLLLLTADRPPELRERGAGQAIDQLKLFGGAAKWFFEVSAPDASPARVRWIRALACRAYWTSLEGRPGVVHLNFPLSEPLVSDEDLPADRTGRREGRPYVRRAPGGLSAPESMVTLYELVAEAERGVVVAGRDERTARAPLGPADPRSAGEAAAGFAAAVGWPVLADPLSGARRGGAAIAHYDALLRDEGFAASVRPDLVVRVGDLPTSKPLRGWLAGLEEVRQVALDPEGAWQDPAAVLSDSLALDPARALADLAREPHTARPEWLAAWREADERAAGAIHATIGEGSLTEPFVAAELGVLLPEEATLFVASSMPVRDIESFWPVRPDPPRVLCNRGANGIDGTVSSAFGAAADGPGPVLLLIGDVALAHDIGGLLAARRLELNLTIVLLDNGGGAIFDFLPVAGAAMGRSPEAPAADRRAGPEEDIYTRHILTPTGLDLAAAARLYGLWHERVESVTAFRAALERALSDDRSSIIEVRGERASNVELHGRVWDQVSRALNQPAAGAAPPA
jgi:2-succinyl-5-enolpyruvyl-6-hydroxy-3-cyclohexene-1-carboxylate synthase